MKLLERMGGTATAIKCQKLPDAAEIGEIIKAARTDAEHQLNKLGVYSKGKNRFDFDSSLKAVSTTNDQGDADSCYADDQAEEPEARPERPDFHEEEDMPDSHDLDVLRSIHEAEFRDYSSKLINAKKTAMSHHFLNIPGSTGAMRLVRKSTIVWFCENNVRRLSNDRNFRVRSSIPHAQRKKMAVKVIERRDSVKIGDWGIFKTCPDSFVLSDISEDFLLGRAISFSHLSQANRKPDSVIWEWDEGATDVGVLCDWYSLSKEGCTFTGSMKQLSVYSHGFYDCRNYVCSVPPPAFDGEVLMYDKATAYELGIFLGNIL